LFSLLFLPTQDLLSLTSVTYLLSVRKLIINIPLIGIRFRMLRRQGKPKLVDLVKVVLEDRHSRSGALTYESLYGKVSDLYGGKPSRRDFQTALDHLEHNDGLVIEKDPSDKRRVRIWRSEGANISSEQALAARRIALADFFRKHPECAPLYVRPSGAIRIRGIEENDASRELTRMFRYTTPLVMALNEIVECEKLGKKPGEAAVRKWWEQYDHVADAIAKATAIEFSDSLEAKRKIETKKIVDWAVETLSKREQNSSKKTH